MSADDEQDRYWMPGTDLKKSLDHSALRAATYPVQAGHALSKNLKNVERSKWIKDCAIAVLSSYRRDDFADPDGYLVQLGMVLERYGDEIIREVTSPTTGIQRTCKFPPSIAEVVEFIDEMVRRKSFAVTYDARSRKQLEEREEFERDAKAEPPEHRKAVAERIQTELGAKGFQFRGDTKPQQQTWQRFSTEDLLKKYPPKHPAKEEA